MTTRALVVLAAVVVAVGSSVLLTVKYGRFDDIGVPSGGQMPAQDAGPVSGESLRAADPNDRTVAWSVGGNCTTVPLCPFPGLDEFGRARLLTSDVAAAGSRVLTIGEGSIPTLDGDQPAAAGQGRAVLVKIVDDRGLPMAGAQVGICVLSHDVWLEGGHRVHWGRADVDGRAAIAERVPCGRWTAAAGPGIELASPQVEVLEGTDEPLLVLHVVGKRVDMLAGGVSVRPDTARHLRVICAAEVPEQGPDSAARVIASTALAPDGSFELNRPPNAPAEVRLGCLLRDGGRWFSDRVFRWGDARCVLMPPLPGSLEVRVFDSQGVPVERFAVLLGADSRTLHGAATAVTNAGFHEGGVLTIQDCSVGDFMLRVLPMDDGLPPSDVLQVRVQHGVNHMTVRLARLWDLLVAVTMDGRPVVGAKVEIIGGTSRAAARDINYTPVINGRLVPNIDSAGYPVRIDTGKTNSRGEALFQLPSAGGPVSVRVSSDTLAILPAFVETVPRSDGESNVDVVVTSGSTIVAYAVDVPSSVESKIRLGLRRVEPIAGAVNSFPISWHHPRPDLRDGKFRLHNVPYGEWIVDVYLDAELVQREIARWTVLKPRHEWPLSLVALGAENRAVSVAWAEQPGRIGQVEVVQLSGETDALRGTDYPMHTATRLTRAAFVRARVKPVDGGASQAWYSSRVFGPDEPIEVTLRPWSLWLQLPQSLVGKKVTVRGPTVRDEVSRDVRAAGVVKFDGVCPFSIELLVGDRVLATGASLEDAIRTGTIVIIE